MKIWAWGAMVVAVGAMGSMLGACGGGSSTGGGGSGGTGGSGVASSSSKSSSASKSSSVVSVSSSSMMVKGSECMAKGNMCAPCCQMDFMMENQVLFGKYVFPKCACDPVPDGGMPPTCAMACAASACMMMNPDQTCVDCINKMVIQAMPQGKCFQDSLAACQGDATCSPLLDCVNTFCM